VNARAAAIGIAANNVHVKWVEQQNHRIHITYKHM
jgi:hypothetical protein